MRGPRDRQDGREMRVPLIPHIARVSLFPQFSRQIPKSHSSKRPRSPQRNRGFRLRPPDLSMWNPPVMMRRTNSGHGLRAETPRASHLVTVARFRAFGQRYPSRTASVPPRGVGLPRCCPALDRPTCTQPPAPAPWQDGESPRRPGLVR